MNNKDKQEEIQLEPESIRCAMDKAWRDHQHTRDQTWKALGIEIALGAGIVGGAWQTGSPVVIMASIALIIIMALCGVQITLRHRNRVEITKFRHIMNCEEKLRLHSDDLIDGVQLPGKITIIDALNPLKGNTALFILRMHLAVMLFAVVLLIWRLYMYIM